MNRILALLAFVALAAFVGILVFEVPEPDLMIVAGLTLALVAYDMFRSSGKN
ncbi:hypothetical protein PARPLA_00453 [Rhodobacteraceae bacterium THAF1]|uniref:hypothetical protein n=1 Tax=Palleronia sp. THAF1 TaxID=2587842 RepID=UPI000F411CB5|nr:hypothetical protein [Palleronia sp. THAF1]QFU09984.1 hypothetical protein FIU81_14995 [Palleronia sp. THAF1]VDC17111.1 hypothetical protein PARPLA_00453 [Rhodobacteraceae bacterium THAF1]